MSAKLRQRSKATLPLQASKWLHCPVLVDVAEMQDLLHVLGEFYIVLATGVTKQGEGFLTTEEFIDGYFCYIEALKKGEIPLNPRIRPYFSTIVTRTLDPLYSVPVGENQQLIKIDKPVIQLQSHRFNYSKADGKFRSMVFGQDSIYWGIQFSYPQLYQDEQYVVKPVRETEEFPNTSLFKILQRWVRAHTIATPFLVGGKQVNVPIRLGKNCFSWINSHPQLAENCLTVKT